LKLWQDIVNQMPSDYFIVGNLPLLKAYVRHCANADLLAKQLSRVDGEQDLDKWDKLARAAYRETGQIGMLATKLRLAQSSRFDKSKRTPIAPVGLKPWERFVP
jgi:hypothetical protein